MLLRLLASLPTASPPAGATPVCAFIISLIDLPGHDKYMKTTLFGQLAYYPNYICIVIDITRIDENINLNCIIPRKPLSSTAKRAGWQGCYILFDNIQIIK